jgi:hypothetical protein
VAASRADRKEDDPGRGDMAVTHDDRLRRVRCPDCDAEFWFCRAVSDVEILERHKVTAHDDLGPLRSTLSR